MADVSTATPTPPLAAPAVAPPTGPAAEREEAQGPDPNATETLYVRNLNEKVKIPVLKTSLRSLFKTYGEVLDVVAHHNIRMRGQAFVSFADKTIAEKALREVRGFPLYGQPLAIEFAKSRSDAVLKKTDPSSLPQHLSDRKAHKVLQRRNNPLRQKQVSKLRAAYLASQGQPAGAPGAPAAEAAAAARPQVQMPDEYLPPNAILFVQNLPAGTGRARLEELFSQYPNLSEIRLIPNRADIAFVEYADEASSSVAREALHNYRIDGETKMKVTFARK